MKRRMRTFLFSTKSIKLLALLAVLTIAPFSASAWAAEEATKSLDVSLQNLKIGILAYIEYSAGEMAMSKSVQNDQEQNFNKFALTRGYITVQKDITSYLTARVTSDIYQETSKKGTSGDGSYVMRLKYYYAEFKIPNLGPLTSNKAEIGMGHIPWLDFEESIDIYRAQGTMAIERAGVFSSADIGGSFMSYFGGTLEDAKKKTGNDKYAGKYGSWHIGVYNGGGYAAVENNQNKVVEGRISLRPLSMIDALAGLQLSYFGLVGEGNTVYQVHNKKDNYWPKYSTNLGMLSYEHPYVVFTGQYFQTVGNAKGTWVYTNKKGDTKALTTDGYSLFLNVKPPILKNKLGLFTRYDYFNEDSGDNIFHLATATTPKKDAKTGYNTMIGGISYDFYKGNMVIVSYEQTNYDKDADIKGNPPKLDNKLGDDQKFQLILQLKY